MTVVKEINSINDSPAILPIDAVPLEAAALTHPSEKSGNRATMRMAKHSMIAQQNIQALDAQLKPGYLQNTLLSDEVKANDLLHQAILENSTVVVQFLVEHGVDINSLNSNGKTPLILSIESNSLAITEILVKAKANLETRRKNDNFSPLEIAISMNENYMASQLLNAGANPNSGRVGQTGLLALALSKGLNMYSVADLLMQKGAEVNGANLKASNPLYQAFSLPEPQRTQIIDKLLEKGADVNRKLENQTTVFCTYIEKTAEDPSSVALIRKLCSLGANVHATDTTGKSALEYAVNKPQIMAVLNEFRTDVKYLNEQLNLAVNQKNQALVQKWLAKGAKINNTDQSGQTPLYRVFSAGDISFSQFLVNNGAKIEESKLIPLSDIIEKQVFTGQTLLDATEFYLHNKAISANSVDKAGRPLISVAVMVGNLALVQKLVAFGAHIEPDKKINGMTPLQLALQFKNEPIAKFLIENGANVNAGAPDSSVIILALQSSLYNLIPLLIDKKVQLNVGANAHYLKNPLSYAIHNGRLDLVQKFIENGADVNYKLNNLVPNALFVAVWKGDLNVIEYLLQKGVQSNLKDSQGSPMWYAIQNGRQDIVTLLLKYGVNQEDIG